MKFEALLRCGARSVNFSVGSTGRKFFEFWISPNETIRWRYGYLVFWRLYWDWNFRNRALEGQMPSRSEGESRG